MIIFLLNDFTYDYGWCYWSSHCWPSHRWLRLLTCLLFVFGFPIKSPSVELEQFPVARNRHCLLAGSHRSRNGALVLCFVGRQPIQAWTQLCTSIAPLLKKKNGDRTNNKFIGKSKGGQKNPELENCDWKWRITILGLFIVYSFHKDACVPCDVSLYLATLMLYIHIYVHRKPAQMIIWFWHGIFQLSAI